jgi:hypothetical protein
MTEMVVLAPYPLCPACREVNGGLVAVRHRQVHLRAHGREACVDRGLAGLLAHLWAVCETRGCCEDEGGRAYVVPTPETRPAAVDLLIRAGLDPTASEGVLWFRVPPGARLDDAEFVGRVLDRPPVREWRWRADTEGRFEPR